MKKFVAIIIFVCVIFTAGCAQSASGYIDELKENDWKAELSNGGVVSLSFEGDDARLKIENGKESTVISGKCIADDKSFVIFVPELAQNYGFEYVPKGNTLELSLNGETITMNKTG